jgi:hypothetical protein
MSLPYYPIITGPIAPYSNVAINPEYYQPSQYFITAIALGQTTTITTSVNNNYVVGQLCRLLIPRVNGTRQLNEQVGYVISIPNPNQVVLGIDSSFYDVFVTSTQPTQPQILAIGDINSGNINASGNLNTSTTIPGSYQNISPL